MPSNVPVCIKLMSGETVFGEYVNQENGIVLIDHPNTVHVIRTKEGSSLVLSSWSAFSEKNNIPINVAAIISIFPLNKHNKKLFGELRIGQDLNEIKLDIIDHMQGSGILENNWLNSRYDMALSKMIDNAGTYSQAYTIEEITKASAEIKTAFNFFILHNFKPEIETRQ